MPPTRRDVDRTAAATVAAALLLVASLAIRAAPLDDAKQWIEKAAAADAAGKLDAAHDAYAKAEQEARTADNVAVQLFAQNNRGVVLMRQGKKGEAAEVFGQMPLDKADPAQRPLYRFNYGRALESAGRLREATEQFWLATKESPGFRPAADGAFRTAVLDQNAADALRIAEDLIKSGQAAVAAENMRRCLATWGDATWGPPFVNAVARCYTEATPAPEEFEKSHLPGLVDVAKAKPALAADVETLKNVFAAKGKAQLDRQDAKAFTGKMLEPAVVAALLKKVGNEYARRGEHEMALLRYSAAWQVDHRSNTDAAVYCAALLRDPQRSLDPDGTRRRRFLDEIFTEKGDLYRQLKAKPENAEPLFRLHVVLGSIFEGEPPHGPPRPYETAKFQWNAAAGIQDELVKKPGFIPSAVVYENSAKELEKGNDKQGAAAQYVKAAEVHVKQADASGARLAIQRARKVGPKALSSDQEAKVERLEASIKGVSKVMAPSGPGDTTTATRPDPKPKRAGTTVRPQLQPDPDRGGKIRTKESVDARAGQGDAETKEKTDVAKPATNVKPAKEPPKDD